MCVCFLLVVSVCSGFELLLIAACVASSCRCGGGGDGVLPLATGGASTVAVRNLWPQASSTSVPLRSRAWASSARRQWQRVRVSYRLQLRRRAEGMGQCEKRIDLSRCHCILKMIILPRQARDKHKESTRKEICVSRRDRQLSIYEFASHVNHCWCVRACVARALCACMWCWRWLAPFLFLRFPYVCPEPVLAK